MNTRTLIRGAGCGVLLTLWYTTRLLGPSRQVVYYHRFPLADVYLAVLLDLLGVSFIAALGWLWIRRFDRAGLSLPLLMAGILLLETRSLVYLYSHDSFDFSRGVWALAGGLLVLFVSALRWKARSVFDVALRGIGWSLFVCGFAIFVLATNLAYTALRTSGPEPPAVQASQQPYSPGQSKVVWVLFDELSYDQTYEHRWPGLTLPNFDRAAAESVTFSNVEPAANYTNVAIPSMLLGRPASRFHSSSTGDLFLYTDDTKKWERFDPSATVFAEARRLGWNSGVVGWANPYCRLMGAWLDDCYWLPYDNPIISKSAMDPGRGIVANAARLPLEGLQMWMPMLGGDKGYRQNWVSLREQNYHLAMEHAHALIRNSSIRFQFIHLPVPHFPAVYDRKAATFSGRGSYLDNLALADLALGELLDELVRSPEWPETTLIISGDHSWRPWIWQEAGFWTAEDEAASKRGFDSRPVVLVHLPNQHQGYAIAARYHAYELALVIKAIMQDRIHGADDLLPQIYTRDQGLSALKTTRAPIPLEPF